MTDGALDWDDLRVFLAVARAGSFSAAARAIGLAQPTVGRRIAALEAKLGARLFEATPTGQKVSSTGRRILGRAARMEEEALALERAAAGRDAGVRGVVRVTASEWLIDRVIAPAIAPLLAANPGLVVDLAGEPQHVSLLRREADVAVRPSRFEHADAVEREAGALGFALYASDAYFAARGAPAFDDGCAGHLIVAMSEAFTKVPDVTWLPVIAPRAVVVARANGRLPMATLVAAGAGMAVLPRFLGDATPSLRRVPAPAPDPVRSLWVATHRDARGVPRVREVARHLRDALVRLRPALAPTTPGAADTP